MVDVGRKSRVVTPAGRRAVIARDGGQCTWPGCDRSGTTVHHIRPWAHGGSSNPENQALVCYWHHRMLHEGGWRMARDDDGQMVVMRPPPRFGPITERHPAETQWRISYVPDLGQRVVRAP